MKIKHLRALSLFTLFIFASNQSTWGVPATGLSVSPRQESPGFLQIAIPENLASVEEIYQAPAKSDPRLLLYIQNAHGSYEAQMKIKQLLEYLYKEYGFKLLFVEGAAEKLNPDYLRLFPDKENNAKLADYLAKQGELTGAEFYLIDGPKDVEAVGIEQAELYRSNYEAFKAVYRNQSEGDKFLGETEQKLQSLSTRVFSSDARRLLSEWKKFEAGHRDFLPYVRQLALESKKILNLDLESLFSQVEWPQITRLLVLQQMEKDLNRVEAEKEKAKLVSFLEAQKISVKLTEAVRELGEKRISMNRLDTSKEEQSENLPRYLLERLVEEAGPKGFYFHDYPAFSLYAGYLILQSELESRMLFDEIGRLFKKLLDELTASETEKNLLELYRDEELLRKLFHLELTRAEWSRVFYRRDWIEAKTVSHRLATLRHEMEKNTRFQKDAKEPAISHPTEEENIPEEKLAVLEGIFNSAFQFYDFARRRESVFYEIIKKEMADRKINKAVLITGGFHTEGVMDLLRADEVNYGVLMPKLTQTVDNVNYLTTMLEKSQTIFDVANLEKILMTQRAEMRQQQGRGDNYDVRLVLNAASSVLTSSANEGVLRERLEAIRRSPLAEDLGLHMTIPASLISNPVTFSTPRQSFEGIFTPKQKGFAFSLRNLETRKTGTVPLAPEKVTPPVMPEMVPPTLPREEVQPEPIPSELTEGIPPVELGVSVADVRRIENQPARLAVAALAGRIAGPDVPRQELRKVFESFAQLTEPAVSLNLKALEGIMKMMSDDYGVPTMATGDEGHLINIKEDLDKNEIKGIEAQLAENPNQQVSVVLVPKAGEKGEVWAKSEAQWVQDIKDEVMKVYGVDIGDRFSMIKLPNNNTSTMNNKLAKLLSRKPSAKPPVILSELSTQDTDRFFGGFVTQDRAKVVQAYDVSLEPDPVRRGNLSIAQRMVGVWFSQSPDKPEEISNKTANALQRNENGRYEINGTYLAALLDKINRGIEALLKISASA